MRRSPWGDGLGVQTMASLAQRISPSGSGPKSFPGLSTHSSWWNDYLWGLGSHQARVTWPHRWNPNPGRQEGHDNILAAAISPGEKGWTGMAWWGQGGGHSWRLEFCLAWSLNEFTLLKCFILGSGSTAVSGAKQDQYICIT